MSQLNLKPFRSYSEHDVVNLFALDRTGLKGMPVSIKSGFNNIHNLRLASNLSTIGNNTFSPRFAEKAEVTPCVSGNKPFGITLYDTREQNQFGYSLVYDKQRRDELQAVVSGEAVPVLRRGMVLVGPWATGESPAVGRYVAVEGTGTWGILSAKTGVYNTGAFGVPSAYDLPVFGECWGGKDADSYSLVYINCTAQL